MYTVRMLSTSDTIHLIIRMQGYAQVITIGCRILKSTCISATLIVKINGPVAHWWSLILSGGQNGLEWWLFPTIAHHCGHNPACVM